MKRSFLLLATLILFSVRLFAQIPFVEKGKTWHVQEFSHSQVMLYEYYKGALHEYDAVLPEGCDTVINNVTYYRMYHTNCSVRADYCHNDGKVCAILRELDGKVYQYDEATKTEQVIMDITLNMGDKIGLCVDGNKTAMSFVVSEATAVKMNGKELKRLVLTSEEGRTYADWTEGIGNLNNPVLQIGDADLVGSGAAFLPYTYTPDGTFLAQTIDRHGYHGQQLVLGENVTASMSAEERGHDNLKYEFVDEQTMRVHGTMWTGSNPNQYIYYSGEYLGDEYKVFDLKRKIVEVGEKTNVQEAYKVDFTIGMLNMGGIYFIHDSEGVHEVYNFTEGFTEEVLGMKTIDVESGKGIPSVYDLTGRRLTEVPNKGLYILNGKKRFVR